MCNMQILKNTRDDSVVLCKSALTSPSLRAPQCEWTSVGVEVVSIHLWVLCFSLAFSCVSLLNKTELESTTVSPLLAGVSGSESPLFTWSYLGLYSDIQYPVGCKKKKKLQFCFVFHP